MEGEICPAIPPMAHGTASPKPPLSPTNRVEEKAISPKTERASPEPNCAICLGKSENKSFTDSCLHQFCFSCLLEWSKVKAECPLCKQSFKSIIHNVRSNEDYDQYHLRPVDTVPFWSNVESEMRRFRSTLTAERRRERVLHNLVQPYVYGSESIPAQRMPHAHQRRRMLTSEFRNMVYTQNMWVNPLPDITGRYRESCPEFYRLNPAQMHRLVPWLNRELTVLLVNNPSHIVAVMDLILNLLTRYPINSVEFRSQVSPHIGVQTSHFLHEFLAFARSPYDMIGFDQSAEYMRPSNFSVEIQSSSDSDSDIIVLSPEPSTSRPTTLSSSTNELGGRRMHQSYPQSAATSHNDTPVAGPSGAGNIMLMLSERFRNGIFHTGTFSDLDSSSSSTTVDVTSEVNQVETVASDPDDCMIVGYVKPRHERTPEIITLDSETEVIEEETISVDDDTPAIYNPLSDYVFSFSSSSTTSDSSLDSDYVPYDASRKKPVKRKISLSKHSRNSSSSKSCPKRRHKCLDSTSSSSSDREYSCKRERSRQSRRSHKRSISSSSSSSEDERLSHKCTKKPPEKQPRVTWRIMSRQNSNGCREAATDHDYTVDYNETNYDPPYTMSEIADFADKSRPKLRSIVITRSTSSDVPVASSSRSSPHHQERSSSRSSSYKQKHKFYKREEKKRKRIKRTASLSPSRNPKLKKKKKKKSKKISTSTDSSS